MKTRNVIILIIVAIYVISPIDLIPLVIIDDIIVAIIGGILMNEGGKKK